MAEDDSHNAPVNGVEDGSDASEESDLEQMENVQADSLHKKSILK